MKAWVKESRYPRRNTTFFYVFREDVEGYQVKLEVDKILPHVIQLWNDGFRVTERASLDPYTDLIIFEKD